MNECQIMTALANCTDNDTLNKVINKHCLKLESIKTITKAYTNIKFKYAMRDGSFTVKMNNSALGV